MLLMHMHVGDWPVLLNFKISKNHPLEGASYPVWSVLHSGSLWAKVLFTIHAPCIAGTPFSWGLQGTQHLASFRTHWELGEESAALWGS
jgi:hypothetical protein